MAPWGKEGSKSMPMYTVRVFKAWGSRDSAMRWVNNYEVQSAATTPDGLAATAAAIADAERQLHHQNVQYLQATVSTWTPDSKPYNPLAFTTIPLSSVGAVVNASPQNVLDLNVAFFVKYRTATGRGGKRFYRGCLFEADVETSGNLRWILSTASLFNAGQSIFSAFRTAMLPFLAGGANTDKIVLAGASSTSVQRVVTDVVPGGVVVNRHDHRYFDRR